LKKRGISAPKADAILPRPEADSYPLSFAQQRMWILNQMEPDSPAYNISSALRIIGELSLEALRAALNQIVTRHETLRTIFVAEEGKPMQVILPAQEVPLPMIDLSELSNEQQKAESKRLGSESAARAFDLGRGPLFSVMIFRIQEQEHVFFLNM